MELCKRRREAGGLNWLGSPSYFTSIAERSRAQWQAVGVMVSVVVVLGGSVYWPTRESTNDLKAQDIETGRLIQSVTSETSKAIQSLAANTVSRQDWIGAHC